VPRVNFLKYYYLLLLERKKKNKKSVSRKLVAKVTKDNGMKVETKSSEQDLRFRYVRLLSTPTGKVSCSKTTFFSKGEPKIIM